MTHVPLTSSDGMDDALLAQAAELLDGVGNPIADTCLAEFDANLLVEYEPNREEKPDSTTHLLDDLLSLSDSDIEPQSTLSPPYSHTQNAARATGTAKVNTPRVRQKEEMEHLRSQVRELEDELDQLRRSSVAPAPTLLPTPTPTDSNANTASTDPASALVWEKLAKRQFEERQRVEVENIKLKELLEGQLRVARSLEKLLRKRSLADPTARLIQPKRRRATPFEDTPALLEEIRTRLPNHFEAIDRILEAAGICDVVGDVHDIQAKTDATGSIVAELVVMRVLPFALAPVTEAMWQCISASRIELHNGVYDVGARSEHEFTMDLQLQLRVRRSETTFHVKGLGARREDEDQDRMLLVFDTVGLTESPLFAGERFNCRENGYCVIERHASSADSSPFTVIKVCVRMWPEVVGGEADAKPPHTNRFLDLLIASYNQNTTVMVQHIENLLFAQRRHT